MNASDLRDQLPIILVILGFLVVYSLYIASLFRLRQDGSRRRWRTADWFWVPLAGVTGVLLLFLWWHMRQGPQ